MSVQSVSFIFTRAYLPSAMYQTVLTFTATVGVFPAYYSNLLILVVCVLVILCLPVFLLFFPSLVPLTLRLLV